MKSFKTVVTFCAILFTSLTGFAQKETFDIISYTIPKGWQKQQVDGGVQLFVTDNKTGGYAIVIITKATASTGSAKDDFTSQWKSLLVNTVTSITNPVMTDPVLDDRWQIHSGNGNYTDGAIKGLATLITATGYNQTVAVVLMTNTQQYQNELLAFINSLELAKVTESHTEPLNPPVAGNGKVSSVVGIWGSYLNETSGTFSNGVPMTTGGHFRKEYHFNANGTYRFIETSASAYSSTMILMYETGTWSADGNQLTLIPMRGNNETWSKLSGKLNWNKLLKTEKRTLEKTVYTFDFHFWEGTKEANLVLQNNKQTVRDGTHNTNSLYQNAWLYKHSFDPNKSSLELPAGKQIE